LEEGRHGFFVFPVFGGEKKEHTMKESLQKNGQEKAVLLLCKQEWQHSGGGVKMITLVSRPVDQSGQYTESICKNPHKRV